MWTACGAGTHPPAALPARNPQAGLPVRKTKSCMFSWLQSPSAPAAQTMLSGESA